jgi:hypothetical protein
MSIPSRALLLVPVASLVVLVMGRKARAAGVDNVDSSASVDNDSSGQPKDAQVGLSVDLLHAVPDARVILPTQNEMFALRTAMHARVSRRVAIALGLEEGFGTSAGYRRYDLAWTLPEFYVYLTPYSRIQLYTLTGFDLRASHFESGPAGPVPNGAGFANVFIGASMGLGVETRLDARNAVRLELRGFVRGRLDDAGSASPFSDATKSTRGVSLGLGFVFF